MICSGRQRRHALRREGGAQPEHSFHSLRRTYASWLVQGGTDLYRVQKLLGHGDIKTTMKYAFLAPDNLAGAVDRVFGLNAKCGSTLSKAFPADLAGR